MCKTMKIFHLFWQPPSIFEKVIEFYENTSGHSSGDLKRFKGIGLVSSCSVNTVSTRVIYRTSNSVFHNQKNLFRPIQF